jgi:hypothetical protein
LIPGIGILPAQRTDNAVGITIPVHEVDIAASLQLGKDIAIDSLIRL